MKVLVIIPARGGSKGLPGKNILPFAGKPLIYHSIDVARTILTDTDICVSTDCPDIIATVEQYGLHVPFTRPAKLASDTATTNDVVVHALEFYKEKNINYDVVVLLQPTSPLRTTKQVQEAISMLDQNCDMVTSVKESHAAAVLCHKNEHGFIESSLAKGATRRQDVKTAYYEVNGAIYVIKTTAIIELDLSNITKNTMYIMPDANSIDIDNILDLKIAEYIFKLKK